MFCARSLDAWLISKTKKRQKNQLRHVAFWRMTVRCMALIDGLAHFTRIDIAVFSLLQLPISRVHFDDLVWSDRVIFDFNAPFMPRLSRLIKRV